MVGPEYIVLENNGIGYQLITPNPFVFSKWQGSETTIYTYQHVREDILALYGFERPEEKKLFRKLLDVSGIGPKGALAILASGQPDQVVRAIENEDEKFLVKFPGVGKKTARQMILDLKGKLQEIMPEAFPNLFAEHGAAEHAAAEGEQAPREEAELALLALGYSDREIRKVAPKLEKEQLTTDEYIKKALQLLLK